MNSGLCQYFRCPDQYDKIGWTDAAPSASGYFRFGENSTCFGAYEGQLPSPDLLKLFMMRFLAL